MVNEVTLDCLLNVGTVPAAEEPRLVYLLIDVKPVEGAEPPQAPVNLAIVLDVSESMRLPVLTQEQFKELSRLGQVTQTESDGVPVWTFKLIPDYIRKRAPSNLEAIRATIAKSTRHLEAGDRVSLVAFAGRSQVLLSGVPGHEQKKVLNAVSTLDSLQLGNETEIAEGLQAGLSEARNGQSPEMVSRVLILTDGFTRNPEKVIKLAKGARIDNIAVSTLGIGTEFNEKLLVEVADTSLGNAYFARNPQEIPPAFGNELAAVQAVTLRDVRIEVKFSAGVELRRAYRVRPAISAARDSKQSGRSVTIATGDLDPERPPAVLLEILAPTQSGGTFRVARASLSHSLSNNERIVVAAQDVVLHYSVSKRREEPNPVVMNTVERVSAYALQTRALDEMAMGNVAGATQKLRAAATRLLAVGETDMAQQTEAQAARLEQGQQVSPEGAKEMRYATRKLTQRLSQE